MNKRILELMKQADYPAPEMAPRAQKLAELIVRECAKIAREYTLSKWDLDNSYSGTILVEKRIKEHFGVEE